MANAKIRHREGNRGGNGLPLGVHHADDCQRSMKTERLAAQYALNQAVVLNTVLVEHEVEAGHSRRTNGGLNISAEEGNERARVENEHSWLKVIINIDGRQ